MNDETSSHIKICQEFLDSSFLTNHLKMSNTYLKNWKIIFKWNYSIQCITQMNPNFKFVCSEFWFHTWIRTQTEIKAHWVSQCIFWIALWNGLLKKISNWWMHVQCIWHLSTLELWFVVMKECQAFTTTK